MNSILFYILVLFFISLDLKIRCNNIFFEIVNLKSYYPVQYCDFTISFISFGNGTDKNAEIKLFDYIKKYNLKSDKISYSIIRWGREGEFNCCIQFNKTSRPQIQKIIFELKVLLNTNKRVIFYNNLH